MTQSLITEDVRAIIGQEFPPERNRFAISEEMACDVADAIEDPNPLDGDRFGIWSWGSNGLAIARATMSFQQSTGPAAIDHETFDGLCGELRSHAFTTLRAEALAPSERQLPLAWALIASRD